MGRAKNKTDTEFGSRLRQAFGGDSDSEIARKLGKTPPDVGKWTKTKNIPLPHILLEIKRITNCNLDWLLTGEGEADADPYRFLQGNSREIVAKLAELQGKTFDEMLNTLLRESIASRGAALFARYPDFETEDIEQMRVLMGLFQEYIGNGLSSLVASRREGAI